MKIRLAVLLSLIAICFALKVFADTPWEPPPARESIRPGHAEPQRKTGVLGSVVELALVGYRMTLADQQGEICAFEPSCSEYAEQALDSCGVVLGLLMIADRLQRCNWTSWSYSPRYYTPRTVEGKMVLSDPVKRNCPGERAGR